MKKVSLSGTVRQGVGSKDAKQLRRDGRVPAVIYGGSTQTHFHMKEIDIQKVIFSPDVYQIELDLDGKKLNAVIQEMQMHPVTDRPMHIDFLELTEGKEVTVALPVRTTGKSIGVLNGGRLGMNFRKLRVKALPAHLPEAIEVDITNVEIGGGVRVREITLDNAQIVQAASDVVVAVKRTRASMSADATEVEGGEEATEEAAAE